MRTTKYFMHFNLAAEKQTSEKIVVMIFDTVSRLLNLMQQHFKILCSLYASKTSQGVMWLPTTLYYLFQY